MTGQDVLEIALRGGPMLVERKRTINDAPLTGTLDVRLSPSRRFLYLSNVAGHNVRGGHGGAVEQLAIRLVETCDSTLDTPTPHVRLELSSGATIRLFAARS